MGRNLDSAVSGSSVPKAARASLQRKLRRVTTALLDERVLIVASNRGPIEFVETPAGLRQKRGAGGVVTAIAAISGLTRPVWVAAAMGPGDRRRAKQAVGAPIEAHGGGYDYHLRFVLPAPDAYEGYYNVIANPLLWFMQHYMWDTPRDPAITRATHRAWSSGYVAVNRLFADTIVEEARRDGRPPVILLQDYHLYLVPAMLRRDLPTAVLQLFVHIPWPDPDYWRILAQEMRVEICASLCACDVVGFQTRRSARSFLRTCESFLPDADIDYQAATVRFQGQLTRARVYPISVDAGAVRRTARSRAASQHLPHVVDQPRLKTVLRVDRVEPSKNILRGFEAYRLLLEEHPELRGTIRFLALLVPSRLRVEEYQRYLDEINMLVGRINVEFGSEHWTPITVVVGDNYARGLAAMRRYDVLLVNPLIDGMNLVAKEAALVNEVNGVLVLSEGAGAFEQLSELAVGVAACDISGTADALYAALTMPLEERRRRALGLRRQVEEHDITRWLYQQLTDLWDAADDDVAGGQERRVVRAT